MKPNLTYLCESRLLTERPKRKLNIMQMRFLKKCKGKTGKDTVFILDYKQGFWGVIK